MPPFLKPYFRSFCGRCGILLVVGVLLLFFAYQASESFGDQVSEAVTGRFTDSTTWFIILGAVSTVAGGSLLLMGRSAQR